MDSGSTNHASHAMNSWMRLQWLARYCVWVLATCPACGANGQGRRTAVTPFLAVAFQVVIATPVIHLRFRAARAPAREHVTLGAALLMGHLVQVHVSGFSIQDSRPTLAFVLL
jgi:hypothetical protein